MKILALDLGKFKSVACDYDTETREAQYVKIKTAPMIIHQLIVRQAHVVQQLAGHSSIKTTQQYYLSVQEDDLEKARRVQSAVLEVDPTDQILTNSGQNGRFQRKEKKRPGVQAPDLSSVSQTRPTGFEPATSGSTVRCSNQLSYGPNGGATSAETRKSATEGKVV